MEQPPYRVRRATVDDLHRLRALWQAMGFSDPGLDKRLTEFQVAVDATGEVVGAVALAMAQGQGLIHSEAFKDFALADEVRPLLWERLQTVARNHGLCRLWTREVAPFWGRCGMTVATAEVLPKLPEPWRVAGVRWWTVQLREEIPTSVERELEVLIQAERQRTQAALERAKLIKLVATVLAIILAMAVGAAALYLWSHSAVRLAP